VGDLTSEVRDLTLEVGDLKLEVGELRSPGSPNLTPEWRQVYVTEKVTDKYMASTLTSMPLDSVMSQSSLLRADELNKSRRTNAQLRIGSNRVVVNVVFALEENLRFMAVNK